MATKRMQIMQDLVKKEARNLRKYATEDERLELNFDDLDPDSPFRCVYGLMTGNCFSERADQLIKQCAERVYNKEGDGVRGFPLNGKPTGGRGGSSIAFADYYSPIEVFILQENEAQTANNKRLLAYLRGETKTLKFK